MSTEKTEPEPFVLDDSAPLGVGRVGTLQAFPADIVRAFGPANVGASGDDKVDREWCFRSREGHGVSVYAYKATSLYGADLPSPSDFWSSEDVYRLSVSGPSEHVGEAFIKWAQGKIAEAKQAEPETNSQAFRAVVAASFTPEDATEAIENALDVLDPDVGDVSDHECGEVGMSFKGVEIACTRRQGHEGPHVALFENAPVAVWGRFSK